MNLMMITIVNNQVARQNAEQKEEEIFFCDDCVIEFKESDIMEVFEGTYFCNCCNQML